MTGKEKNALNNTLSAIIELCADAETEIDRKKVLQTVEAIEKLWRSYCQTKFLLVQQKLLPAVETPEEIAKIKSLWGE